MVERLEPGPTPTSEEEAQAQRDLTRVQELAKDGFFTTRVENQAIEEGHKVEGGIVVYEGGGNA